MTKRPINLRAIAEFLVVAVCTTAFALTAIGISGTLLAHNAAGSRDFVEYWAAGRQLVHHANPYDGVALLKLERATGFPEGIPAFIMPNPPSALLLVFPLGIFSPAVGEVLWELLLLACLVASVNIIRGLCGYPKGKLHLLAYAFAPVLSCLLSGQVSIFLLFGLVLFLRLHGLHPFWAGTALWLCLLKPHLFLPFGVVLLLWIFLTRNYRILAGTAVALGVSSAMITIANPHIWTQYFQMMNAQRVDRVLMPCLGSLLRQYVPPHTLWLQCLPAGIACVWALTYFWKRRGGWDWINDGLLLLLVSVFVSPYSWFMDQAIVLPALLYGAYSTRSRTMIAILALMSATIEIETIFGVGLLHAHIWAAPAWLVWYLVATRAEDTKDVRVCGVENDEALTA